MYGRDSAWCLGSRAAKHQIKKDEHVHPIEGCYHDDVAEDRVKTRASTNKAVPRGPPRVTKILQVVQGRECMNTLESEERNALFPIIHGYDGEDPMGFQVVATDSPRVIFF